MEENMILPTLRLKAKNLYGTERYFPQDDISIAIAKIKGGKTLLMSDLEILNSVGFEIRITR